MTQTDHSIQTNTTAQLQDLLHLIAHDPSLNVVAPAILSEARIVAQAAAGFYVVFKEPFAQYTVNLTEEQVPPVDELVELVSKMTDEIHIGSDVPEQLSAQYKGWVLVPIHYQQEAVALLCLLSDGLLDLEKATSSLMGSLVDGLTIVTASTKAHARYEKLLRNQNEFVRIVSHDLRSPLTSMHGFASMLEAQGVGELNDQQIRFAGKIISGVNQMAALVDNIQDAGRYDPETGFYEMERKPVDMIDVVQKIANTHLMPAEKQALTLSVNVDPDVPIVNVDTNMIERSITNLVDNAIKYTPDGGHIEVGARRVGSELLITVKDDGLGISEENARMLFQRHFRIRRKEHKLVKGSGLGLFIVRSVARRHGGDAFVESVEGEGSTFGIRIPLRGKNLLGSA